MQRTFKSLFLAALPFSKEFLGPKSARPVVSSHGQPMRKTNGLFTNLSTNPNTKEFPLKPH